MYIEENTILIFAPKNDHYKAKAGAKVRVLSDYDSNKDPLINVKFIDDPEQNTGEYYKYNFVTINEWREIKLKELGI